MSKKYGLIVPNKSSKVIAPQADFSKPSIFGNEDSDSDNAPPSKIMGKIGTQGPGANQKRQARKLQQQALAEDPTVFQYDELYDEIESKRNEAKQAKSQEIKKPKYIERLLEYSERRKIDNERRLERVVQKERELEGEEFKDKEAFVTSSYRKKLEELKEAEEREKREDYLEAIGDVTKQRDLGGFYRHLYEQKLGPKDIETKTKPSTDSVEVESSKKFKTTSKSRAYRKRKSSEEESDHSSPKIDISAKKIHLQSNLDADSDFSIDSSSDSECETKPPVGINSTNTEVKEAETEIPPPPPTTEVLIPPEEIKAEVIKDEDIKNVEVLPETEIKPKKEKIYIWKKRTVGDAFDAAFKRYCERKSLRNL